MSEPAPQVSVVVPLYNEEENVKEMQRQLTEALRDFTHELVLVDDGSSDGTAAGVEKSSSIRLLSFKKNSGQSAAMYAGIMAAKGDVIIMIDGDLQNDPADIPKLVHKLNEGYDLVCGYRAKRKDTTFKRFQSRIANAVRSRFIGDGVRDTGCSLKALRRERPGTPVIILSARGEENDRVRGLRLGADDYVVKPFSVRELLARVEAVLRRAPERQPVSETLTLTSATIDFGQSVARFENGESAELSERERDVLRYLALNRGRPVSREELLQRVWHIDNQQTETRTVDMHIANLRHKLRDDAESPRVIVTIRGKGYQLT